MCMKTNNKKFIFLTILYVTLGVIIVIGVAYAFLPFSNSTLQANVSGIVAEQSKSNLVFSDDTALSLSVTPDSVDPTSSVNMTATITSKVEGESTTNYYNIYLVLPLLSTDTIMYTQGTSNPELLLTIYRNGTEITSGVIGLVYNSTYDGFDLTQKTGIIKIVTNQAISTTSSTTGTTDTWTFTLKYITSYEGVQNANMGKTIKPVIVFSKGELSLEEQILAYNGGKASIPQAPITHTRDKCDITIGPFIYGGHKTGVSSKYYYYDNGNNITASISGDLTYWDFKSGLTGQYSSKYSYLENKLVYRVDGDSSVGAAKANLHNITNIYRIYNATSAGFDYDIASISVSNCSHDDIMYYTTDNDGKTYLFNYLNNSGISTNDYVSFAGVTWKVVRINGDGSVRLLYTGTDYETNSYFTSGVDMFDTTGGLYYTGLVAFWNDHNLDNYRSYIENSTFCYSKITGYQNLECASNLIAPIGDETNTYPIGLLTAQEAYFAGVTSSVVVGNYTHYISGREIVMPVANQVTNNKASFIYGISIYFGSGSTSNSYIFRPVINLKAGVKVSSGNGTASSPYVIS